MRILVAALAFALLACAPPAAQTEAPEDAAAGSTGVGQIELPPFTLTPAAIGGQWSFDRTCGLYDLVFTETGADYYDYSDSSHAISYNGTWAIAQEHTIVLAVQRLDDQGRPTGDVLTYLFEVTAPPSEDLVGRFGPQGGEMRDITAKQCAFEDRE